MLFSLKAIRNYESDKEKEYIFLDNLILLFI